MAANSDSDETSPANEAGLEAPPPPAADPTNKTDATSDPTADDPGNGAD
jgi:hypothetical protein